MPRAVFCSDRAGTDHLSGCRPVRDHETNVTDDDVTVTAKIARVHLNEFPDYYTRLAVMESEAEAYWADRGE